MRYVGESSLHQPPKPSSDGSNRFEPDYEEYSLVPFITSYMTSSDSSYNLPPPPYPSWLWPTISLPSQSASTHTTTRERSTSNVPAPSPPTLLPFPHPLHTRKHPTMRLIFPSSSGGISTPAPLSPTNSNTLSRVPTRAEKPTGGEENRATQSLVSIVSDIISAGLSGVTSPFVESEVKEEIKPEPSSKAEDKLSDVQTESTVTNRTASPSGESSLEKKASSRQATLSPHEGAAPETTSPSEVSVEEQVILNDDDDEDEEEEDDDEEEEEEVDTQPASQYISALDLAGF